MSKIPLVLLVILVLQFIPFASRVHAAESCSSSNANIAWGNKANNTTNDATFFLENTGDLIFSFTIKDLNTLSLLKDKQVRLSNDRINPFNSETIPTTIKDLNFELTISKDKDEAKKGDDKKMTLEWENEGGFDDLCSISYTVGAGNSCIMDQSNLQANGFRIPPVSTVTIQFLGNPDTEYQLAINTGLAHDRRSRIKTEADGTGEFKDVAIKKNIGDKFKFSILETGTVGSCHSREITVSAGASSIPPPAGPVIPTTGAKGCTPEDIVSGKCTSSGDKEKVLCGDDPKDPGIRTAIGCIHTSPAGFVKDFLKFIIGIAGGLAFLMMLLGAFQMLTSAGNPETLAAGRDRLTSAIIGLLFVIFALLLLRIIGVDILGLEKQFGF